MRQLLEVPISATLNTIVLSTTNFGLSFQLPSVTFQQCRTILRSSLRSSKDDAINNFKAQKAQKAQSKLPNNIFKITVKYLNNTFASRNNLCLCKLAASPDCSFCLESESLLHIVTGCKSYLDQGRFTWRHNSALKFLAQTLESVKPSNLYLDLPGYLSPCIITGDSLHPDMLLIIADKCLYII